jgi:hypothetical protein
MTPSSIKGFNLTMQRIPRKISLSIQRHPAFVPISGPQIVHLIEVARTGSWFSGHKQLTPNFGKRTGRVKQLGTCTNLVDLLFLQQLKVILKRIPHRGQV